ncbi:MAG: glycosyltransferase family 4 protein [Chloroflexi bacterium]|nr:glycosyltransferase family 4 protein [Chloroflexota bacterium]
MRLVFVGTFGLHPKSTMRLRALPLARALARRGHTVTVLLPPWDAPADAGRSMIDSGVQVVNLPLPPRVPLLWYGLLTAHLFLAARALQPQVVHAFKPKGFSGAVAQAFLALRRLGHAGPRVVVDTDDWEGPGGWNDMNPYPAWQRRVFAAQEEALLRRADVVTAASRTLADLAAARRGGAGVVYLPNGVEPPLWDPGPQAGAAVRERLGLGDGPVLLLYTRFVEFGLPRLVATVQAVAERVEGLTLLVVGAGLNGEEQQLAALVQCGRVPCRVVQVGWAAPAEVPGYFAAADVALFPMDDTLLNRTKCSVKLIDLLSAGVPVVADRVGQTAEYLAAGESGELVTPGCVEEMAAAVARLLADRLRRETLGRHARARLRERFAWDTLVAAAEQAYAP